MTRRRLGAGRRCRGGRRSPRSFRLPVYWWQTTHSTRSTRRPRCASGAVNGAGRRAVRGHEGDSRRVLPAGLPESRRGGGCGGPAADGRLRFGGGTPGDDRGRHPVTASAALDQAFRDDRAAVLATVIRYVG